MGIAVLGPLQVDGGTGTLARRDRVVLAVLAIRTGDLVSADQLAEALWGDNPPATWNKALQGTVVRLRKLLGGSMIETVDHGYRLTLPTSDVDAHESGDWSVARGSCWSSLSPSERRTSWGRHWRCVGVRRYRTSRSGNRAAPRPTGWRSCAGTRRSFGSTP